MRKFLMLIALFGITVLTMAQTKVRNTTGSGEYTCHECVKTQIVFVSGPADFLNPLGIYATSECVEWVERTCDADGNFIDK